MCPPPLSVDAQLKSSSVTKRSILQHQNLLTHLSTILKSWTSFKRVAIALFSQPVPPTEVPHASPPPCCICVISQVQMMTYAPPPPGHN